jgi:hypothetical protein
VQIAILKNTFCRVGRGTGDEVWNEGGGSAKSFGTTDVNDQIFLDKRCFDFEIWSVISS